MNVAEVIIDDDSVGIEEAIDIAVITGAPFISLDLEVFDSAELLDEDAPYGDPNDSAAARKRDRLIKSAGKHNGEPERLWLRWAANGLTYGWTTDTPDWRQKLTAEIDKANLEVQLESSAQSKAQEVASEALINFLAESPEFRAAPVRKRKSLGLALIAGSEHETDDWTAERAIARAALQVERVALQVERSLAPELDEVAAELWQKHAWQMATTNTKRQEVANDFLIKRSGGYMLSATFSKALVDTTKKLDETNIEIIRR
ncbi:hypothetical protein [Arthrobacter sp. efr-133-TYG-118]|uniref:hypothetical protein n=1 Tax=Arthrobacter sp. efr-133-TYG-118 TaxID=3040279 RepID=UPI00254A6434|nr:hypothetical protein [Arthrobacter sp. efr-133-TYG-118]